VVSFTPLPLYSRGKNPRYPLDRRLGGPQSRSGRLGEEKILDPAGTRTPTPRSSSPQPVGFPVYVLTEKEFPILPITRYYHPIHVVQVAKIHYTEIIVRSTEWNEILK
jgi:hypothetical protein